MSQPGGLDAPMLHRRPTHGRPGTLRRGTTTPVPQRTPWWRRGPRAEPSLQAARLAATGYDDAAREARSKVRNVAAIVVFAMLGACPAGLIEIVAANMSSINAVYQTTQTSWVLTTGTVLGALTMLPIGKLGDIHGKKRLLVIQLGIILLGCLIAAATTNFSLLLVGTALQGLGITLQVSYYGIIRDTFPRRWIPMAIAWLIVGFLTAVPASIMLGGYLTEHYSYHAIFWALSGYMALVTLLTVLIVPETPLRTRDRMDWNSVGVLGVALFMLTYGLNESSVPGRGWNSAWTIGFLGGGIVLMAFWLVYERRPEQSTIGLNLMAKRSVNSVLIMTLLTGIMLFIIANAAPTVGETPPLVPVALRSDGTPILGSPGYGLGLNGVGYGQLGFLALLPGIPVTLLAAVWARHRGARWLAIVGPLLFAGSLAFLATVTVNRTQLILADGLAQAGIGILLLAYPLLIIEAVPAHSGGVGLGAAVIFQGIGDSIGSQLFATISAANVFVANPFTGVSVTTHRGIQTAFILGAAFGVAAFLSGFLIPHGRTRSSGGALPAAAEVAAMADAAADVPGGVPSHGMHPSVHRA